MELVAGGAGAAVDDDGPGHDREGLWAAVTQYAVTEVPFYINTLLYDAAKFPVGLSSLGLLNISGGFLRGPPPHPPQSVIKWQLANPPSFWLSNGIE